MAGDFLTSRNLVRVWSTFERETTFHALILLVKLKIICSNSLTPTLSQLTRRHSLPGDQAKLLGLGLPHSIVQLSPDSKQHMMTEGQLLRLQFGPQKPGTTKQPCICFFGVFNSIWHLQHINVESYRDCRQGALRRSDLCCMAGAYGARAFRQCCYQDSCHHGMACQVSAQPSTGGNSKLGTTGHESCLGGCSSIGVTGLVT